MLPNGLVKSSVPANANSIVPPSTSASINSKPRVAAARGKGTRPSTPSQKGPDRPVAVSIAASLPLPASRNNGRSVEALQYAQELTTRCISQLLCGRVIPLSRLVNVSDTRHLIVSTGGAVRDACGTCL